MVVPLNLALALAVSHRMDPVWRAERELQRDRWDPDRHAMDVINAMAVGYCYVDEDEQPLLAGGLMGGPGVMHTFMFGAVGWERAVQAAVREGRRMLERALTVDGVHRVQCISLCQHEQGRKFLEAMGLRYEHELRGWGKGGESFHLLARTRED